MNVRRTQSAGLIWGRRQRRDGRAANHSRATATGTVEPTGAGEASFSFPEMTPGRRQGGPSQDRALYACSCGYVFNALVSTSVDCPACGDTQAW